MSRFLALASAGAAGLLGGACGDDLGKAWPDAEIIIIEPDGGGGQVDAPVVSCELVFLTPASMATLGPDDDKSMDRCADGLQYDVTLAAAGAEGKTVSLNAGGVPVGTAVVSGGRVTFANATLGQGPLGLTATIEGPGGCSVTTTVTVSCNVPTCTISKPVLSDEHPKLNGLPAGEGGDRASGPGADYQTEFQVMTNIEDGRQVVLNVRRQDAPNQVVTYTASATGGRATFPGVTLRPDGTFLIQAVCTNTAGVQGRSTEGMYMVDTVAPVLNVTAPTDGQHYGPGELNMGKFEVCATTTDMDAIGLPATRANMGRNLCAAIGTASPVCAGVTMAAMGGEGCVALDCPGGAPFGVTVTLRDEAGNVTTRTVQAVTCASTLPSVQIVTPQGDVPPFADVSKRLLASNSTNPLRDADPNISGAQTTVVACTDRQNATARLLGGIEGDMLAQLGMPVAVAPATSADGCPSGLGFAARWVNVTVPDSSVAASGTLTAATQLRVEVTDVSTAVGTSPAVNLWVDSTPPSVRISNSTPLCDRIFDSAAAVTTSVTLITTTQSVTLTVNGPMGQQTYTPTGFGSGTAILNMVTFDPGQSTVTVTASEPSGNTAELATQPCTVLVGQVPIVTITSPPAGRNLCAADNTLPSCVPDGSGTPGWQGPLSVTVTQAGAPATTGSVTFFVDDVSLGTVNIVAGVASLPSVTIPDGAAVTLSAVTDDFASTGTGRASRTLIVDTVNPDAIASVTVAEEDRRATSFRLSWTAPGDSGGSAANYDVRVATTAIADETAFAAAENVPFGGAASAAGQPDSVVVGGRMIERAYHFAVRAVDRVGNRGPITSAGPATARFRSFIISPPITAVPTGQFSFSIEGFSNLINDGDNVVRSELLVGPLAGQNAYVYRGTANPSDTNLPAIIIAGPAGAGFGRSFVNIGNIDGLDDDGVAREDFAIGAPDDGNGKVYIFKGRATWAASYNHTDRDYEIDLGAAYAGRFFGTSIARLGDLNNDGHADFAIGAAGFNGNQGRTVIVFGKQGFSASSLDLALIDGAPSSQFGSRITGLGRFYAGAGNSFLVAASGTTVRAVYAFGPLGPGSYGVIDARHQVSNPGLNNFTVSMGFLGPIGGLPGVGVGAPASSRAFLYSGTTGTGPFATAREVRTSTMATNFGRAIFSSAHPGTSVVDSIIGDSTWDAVITSTAEGGGPGRAYIVDGTRVGGLSSMAFTDLATISDVILTLPQGWGLTSSQRTGVIRDYDGDGYADVAIGEQVANQAGRVIVYY